MATCSGAAGSGEVSRGWRSDPAPRALLPSFPSPRVPLPPPLLLFRAPSCCCFPLDPCSWPVCCLEGLPLLAMRPASPPLPLRITRSTLRKSHPPCHHGRNAHFVQLFSVAVRSLPVLCSFVFLFLPGPALAGLAGSCVVRERISPHSSPFCLLELNARPCVTDTSHLLD